MEEADTDTIQGCSASKEVVEEEGKERIEDKKSFSCLAMGPFLCADNAAIHTEQV
jgi:hypothetical protein